MEQTQNKGLNPMTFNCDLDPECEYLSDGFCSSSLTEMNILLKFNVNLTKSRQENVEDGQTATLQRD